MNRRERLVATVQGIPVDRPPVSAWMHLATVHLTAEESADVHLRFQREYDWDYLKAMNDYRLPTREGFEEFGTGGDLERFADDLRKAKPFANQREVLSRLRSQVAADLPVLETLFDPLQALIRVAGANVLEIVRLCPEEAQIALAAITDAMVEHVHDAIQLGIDGLFLSVNGATSGGARALTDVEFSSLVVPYARRIFAAAAPGIRIGHIHGDQINLARVNALEFEVMNWSDAEGNLSFADVARAGRFVPLGGLDERLAMHSSPSQIRHMVARAQDATAGRLILGPGCTLPSGISCRVLRAFRSSVMERTVANRGVQD